MYFYFLLAILLFQSFQDFLLGKNLNRIKNVCNTVFNFTSIFSVLVMGIFFFFANDISIAIYDNIEVGRWIKILSFLVIFMYIDNIVDGMLKGINEHVSVMLCNILDLIVTILIIFFIVPILGMEGYILSIFVSELLNFSVSLYQLKRRVNFSFPLLLILKCVIAVLMSYIITSLISFNGFTGVINLVINVSIFIIFYFIFTFISKCYIFKK